MPGIAGIISKMFPEKNEIDLRLMIHSMMHESFYTSGTYEFRILQHILLSSIHLGIEISHHFELLLEIFVQGV